MFQVTKSVVVAAFGAGRSDGALLAVPVIPAAALVDGVTAAAGAVASGVSWLRRSAARVLRSAAERLDAVPVATAASYPVATVAEAEEWPEGRWTLAPAVEVVPTAPVILPMPEPMPSAAQVTTEAPVDLAAVLAEHGTVRAAARAPGVAESTLRGRCRKAGVRLPGRKAKG